MVRGSCSEFCAKHSFSALIINQRCKFCCFRRIYSFIYLFYLFAVYLLSEVFRIMWLVYNSFKYQLDSVNVNLDVFPCIAFTDIVLSTLLYKSIEA